MFPLESIVITFEIPQLFIYRHDCQLFYDQILVKLKYVISISPQLYFMFHANEQTFAS